MTTQTTTLEDILYELGYSEDLTLSLLAFFKKNHSQETIELIVNEYLEHNTKKILTRLLYSVVCDDLGGVTYLHDWHRICVGSGDWDEPEQYELIHSSGYNAYELYYIHNAEAVNLSLIPVY